MMGQLSEHPLAELLHEISVNRLSGALRLEQERLKTVVYLAEGEVIYAASNVRRHRLAECVRRWQALAEEELAQLPREASDFELARLLVAENLLSHEAVAALQSRALGEILRPALLWLEGAWEFDARVRLTEDVGASADIKSLLLEGARRLPQEFAAARLADATERVWLAQDAPLNLQLLPAEAFVLSRVDAPLQLSELLAVSTLPETETRQIVYALTLGGLLERERWPRAFTLEMLARARSVKAPAKEAAPQAVVSAPLVKEEVPPVPVAAVNAEVEQDSGVDELFARLATAETHYQVLGVRSAATAGEIKSSYHKLAKRFHPDRFHKGTDATLHARVGEAFARIAQAYETLKDKQTRATYDLKLSQQSRMAQASAASQAAPEKSERSAQASASVSQLQQAEESFKRGMQALQQGQSRSAISYFAEAARLAPRESRYRAYYGRALSDNEGTWRQAETELKAAITLDSNNAGYHVMLAEFYSKIRLPRRAQSELERALAIDAHHAAARQLLDKLQTALKG